MVESTSTVPYSVLAILALCCYIYWFYKKSFNYWKKRGIPDISPSFPFGDAIDLFTGKCSFGHLFRNCYLELKKRGHKHGGMYYLWKPVYVPVDPEIIKRILITDADNFPNHGMYTNPRDDPLSGHLFNMEDGEWRALRSKIPQAFTSAKMKNLFPKMLDVRESFRKRLAGFEERGESIEINSIISEFTVDIVLNCAFGVDSGTLKNQNREVLYRVRNFFDYQFSIYKNTMVIVFSRALLKYFKFRIFSKSTEKFAMDMFTNIINNRLQHGMPLGELGEIHIKLMEKDEDDKDKNPMKPLDMKQAVAQMFMYLSAGSQTSGNTQTYAVYEIAANPDVQKKLREEINSVLKNHNGELTYDGINEMKYLDNVIDETLRKYPTFPILPRVCNNNYTIPGTDVILEKNSFVIVTNYGIQSDPEYYPDPKKFDPERFNQENKRTRPFVAHLPFGEGPRVCVGKRFGLLEVKLGLITMVKNFEILLSEKTTEGFDYVWNELVLRKTGDIWIKLKKIN